MSHALTSSVSLTDCIRYAEMFRAARRRLSNAINRDDCLSVDERVTALWLADEMQREAALLRASANIRDPFGLDLPVIDADLLNDAHGPLSLAAE
ncbi:hypothetical protein [Methylobacterium oryzisoli]|uniref:hypothetical protein n=1 Tax=Methylobacterium oryzisoli TaxID=3385502 RepID=UPI0038916173